MNTLFHAKALGIKFLIVLGAFIIGLQFAISFTEILVASILFTFVGFYIGDLIIFPRFGNFVASILDGALMWGIGSFLYENYLAVAPIFSAIAIALAEAFYHYTYLETKVFEQERAT